MRHQGNILMSVEVPAQVIMITAKKVIIKL